jgi:hypothetical protein
VGWQCVSTLLNLLEDVDLNCLPNTLGSYRRSLARTAISFTLSYSSNMLSPLYYRGSHGSSQTFLRGTALTAMPPNFGQRNAGKGGISPLRKRITKQCRSRVDTLPQTALQYRLRTHPTGPFRTAYSVRNTAYRIAAQVTQALLTPQTRQCS